MLCVAPPASAQQGAFLALAPNHSITSGRFSERFDQGSTQETGALVFGGGHVARWAVLALYMGGGIKGGSKDATSCRGAEPSCGSSSVRVGLGGEFRLPLDTSFTPWVFLGVGLLRRTFSRGRADDLEYLGTEVARVMVGADFPVNEHAFVAPVFGVVPTRFAGVSFQEEKHRNYYKIDGITTHISFEFGLRISLKQT